MVDNPKSIYNKCNLDSWFLVQCYYKQNYNNYTMLMHSHERIEIMYVNIGEMHVDYLENTVPKKIVVHTCEYVLIDAGVPHKITIKENCRTQTLNLEIELFKLSSPLKFTWGHFVSCDAIIKNFFDAKVPIIKLLDVGFLYNNITTIQSYIGERHESFNDSYIDLLVAQLLLTVAKAFNKQRNSHIGIVYLKKAVQFINENYAAEISSALISKVSGVTQNYLNQLFSEKFKMGINQYVNRLRIERAIILIHKTDLSLYEIYTQVGYKNKQNFNKNFVKYTKTSPTEYKKKLNAENDFRRFVGEDANKIWDL